MLLTFEAKRWSATPEEVQAVTAEFQRLIRDFPAMVPDPNLPFATYQASSGYPYVHVQSLLGVVHSTIARLRTALEEESSVVGPLRGLDFMFVSNGALRDLLKRDFLEAQRIYVARSWKSVLILTGGILEALLLDIAQKNSATVLATQAAKGKKSDLLTWDLGSLIATCVEAQLVSPYVNAVSEPTRQYRNLVHPGNELRTGLKYEEEDARIAIASIELIHREAS